jgi:hypothetical protein
MEEPNPLRVVTKIFHEYIWARPLKPKGHAPSNYHQSFNLVIMFGINGGKFRFEQEWPPNGHIGSVARCRAQNAAHGHLKGLAANGEEGCHDYLFTLIYIFVVLHWRRFIPPGRINSCVVQIFKSTSLTTFLVWFEMIVGF